MNRKNQKMVQIMCLILAGLMAVGTIAGILVYVL